MDSNVELALDSADPSLLSEEVIDGIRGLLPELVAEELITEDLITLSAMFFSAGMTYAGNQRLRVSMTPETAARFIQFLTEEK